MKHLLLIFISFLITQTSYGQNLPLLKISSASSYIMTENDEPFFLLGGTAWELIHRLNREEVDKYLIDRANKGFTVIQTVILAELNGLNTPNALLVRDCIAFLVVKQNHTIQSCGSEGILRYYSERLNYFKTGSGVPHIAKSILDNLRIPLLDKVTQNKIADLFVESFKLKKQSENILEVAKRAVEIAIEENEELAIAYIDLNLKQIV